MSGTNQVVHTEPPYEEIPTFSHKIAEKLRNIQNKTLNLQTSDMIRDRRLWRDAYYEYQDIAREIALIEQFAIPTLIRYNDTDHLASCLVAQLANEIGFPKELLPIATTASNQYYWAKPELGVIAMPIGDAAGLLGLPDLIHEMGHILLEVSPQFLDAFRPTLKEFYVRQRNYIIDLGSTEKDNKWLNVMMGAWGIRIPVYGKLKWLQI